MAVLRQALVTLVGEELVTRLLDLGADPLRMTNVGITALNFSLGRHHIVQLSGMPCVIELGSNDSGAEIAHITYCYLARIMDASAACVPLLEALAASDPDAVDYILTRGIVRLRDAMHADFEALVTAVPPAEAVHPVRRNRLIELLVFHASLQGHLLLVEYLMEAFRLRACNDTTMTPLWAAVTAGHHEIVEHLLNSAQPPVDINGLVSGRSTLMHCAVAKGHAPVVRVLLGHGADINVLPWYRHEFGGPVRLATSAAMVHACVDNGAFKNCLGFDDGAAVAAIAADTPLLNAYLALGCDLRYRKALLPTAIRNKQVENIETLLQFPLDVDSEDEIGLTALHNALMKLEGEERVAVVKRLVEYGADLHALTNYGMTALDLAAVYDPVVAELLVKHAGTK